VRRPALGFDQCASILDVGALHERLVVPALAAEHTALLKLRHSISKAPAQRRYSAVELRALPPLPTGSQHNCLFLPQARKPDRRMFGGEAAQAAGRGRV